MRPCYSECTDDAGQTMGLIAPLVWVTPSASMNKYEPKAQDWDTAKNLARLYTRKSGSEDGWRVSYKNDRELHMVGDQLDEITIK